MAHDVSPYLRAPRRDLPTACKQARHAQGLRARQCGACALSDLCKRAMQEEAQAVSRLPQSLGKNAVRAIARIIGRRTAA